MKPDLREIAFFVEGPPAAVRAFRAVYAVLTLNFAVPVIGYVLDRSVAEGIVSRLDVALGGPPIVEKGELWHMLAIGNVATLAFLCAILWLDLRQSFAALPALVFLKATSAFVSLGIAVTHRLPAFACIFLLDGVTAAVMAVTAARAYRALTAPESTIPIWSYLLVFPWRIQASLDRIAASGRLRRVPTLFQIALGIARMLHRLVTRPNSVGTSRWPVRRTVRSRVLRFRAIRIIVLLWERAVAPFDLSGLASRPERIVRHVLAAHHEGSQILYDLELLSLHEGWLETLRDAAATIAEERTPRARFLADLCVYEGYHAEVAALTRLYLAGEPVTTQEEARDPDVSLFAYLEWCAARPHSAKAFLASRRSNPGEQT